MANSCGEGYALNRIRYSVLAQTQADIRCKLLQAIGRVTRTLFVVGRQKGKLVTTWAVRAHTVGFGIFHGLGERLEHQVAAGLSTDRVVSLELLEVDSRNAARVLNVALVGRSRQDAGQRIGIKLAL